MPDLSFTGAVVLGPEGLRAHSLHVSKAKIVADAVARQVDLTGYLILPGIVDLHGDGFERHLAQRRGAMTQVEDGLVSCEAELAANGITTAVLAQFISWEGGMRGFTFAERVFTGIRDTRPHLVTDLQAQLRFEVHLMDLYADLLGHLRDWDVRYVVFNDHLPSDRLRNGQTPARLNGQALMAGRSPEAHLAYMQALFAERDQIPAALDWLCPKLAAAGIQMGSHDDATAQRRQDWRARGATIAEFPETPEAVEAAAQSGDQVIMGAPNAVRGGSHNGNVSARDVIAAGRCTALASDYHYPSPRRAAFALVEAGITDLAVAWSLISDGPARVMGWTDRGTLEIGKRADFVVLEAETHRVAATFVAGRVSYMMGDIAERLLY
ncbi:MAG: alpha-D-ribose 1-methylphosphonate 5-triphosphate diphosphatase [Pseudomonadota bacterium]